jgi:hypothetical protein
MTSANNGRVIVAMAPMDHGSLRVRLVAIRDAIIVQQNPPRNTCKFSASLLSEKPGTLPQFCRLKR